MFKKMLLVGILALANSILSMKTSDNSEFQYNLQNTLETRKERSPKEIIAEKRGLRRQASGKKYFDSTDNIIVEEYQSPELQRIRLARVASLSGIETEHNAERVSHSSNNN